ncbi:hypothetical protein D3C78_1718490 [compost metagenome]
MLKAVPAGNGVHLLPVGVKESPLCLQPYHCLGIHIEAHGIRLKHEAPAANTDVHHLAGKMLAYQLHPCASQGGAHVAGVELLVLLEVRT